jgi:hypothetical protein
VAHTEERLCEDAAPIWTSDGLDAYGAALFARHHIIETYPRTGKKGRPRRPKMVACPTLRYGQVVRQRDEKGRIVGVAKRKVYGDVLLNEICTSYIERNNLSLRHENKRLTRKTIAFSKEVQWLERQLHLYQAFFNLVRCHRGLRQRIKGKGLRRWRPRTPAMAAGLTDHIWTLRELMCFKTYINH